MGMEVQGGGHVGGIQAFLSHLGLCEPWLT